MVLLDLGEVHISGTVALAQGAPGDQTNHLLPSKETPQPPTGCSLGANWPKCHQRDRPIL